MVKQKFSTAWKASKQPRKQRKYLINAPKHVRRKFLVSTLTKELRKKHGVRNIELRTKDEVEVMRGKFSSKRGKVTAINLKKLKVAIEGMQATKRDGAKANVWFTPSRLRIVVLNEEDKKRFTKKQNIKQGENQDASDKK